MVGRLARRALDLFVALVADEQDLEVVAREAHGLAVHLGHERAGGVDGVQAAVGGGVHDRRRDAVRAEDDVGALGHLVDLVDEDRALLLELGHDVDVVHDLLAHVDGRAVVLERLLDGDHGAVDAGAVAARRREQHALVSGDGDILEPAAHARDSGHAEADSRGIRRTRHGVHPTRAMTGRRTAARDGERPMTDAPATREAPWPVALLSGKLKHYLDRLGTVWVEGEITQWGVSGGNVYGKLKDLEADATISFQMWSSVRARFTEQFKQGDHVDRCS